MTEQEKRQIAEARMILARHLNRNPVLASWQAVLDYCALTVRGEVECFHVLFLDRKNRLIADEQISVGTVDHVAVYPREIVKRALMWNATAILICHNHPAGDPEPSQADIAVTRKVRNACQVMEITLHDHIIVGAGFEISLRARGDL